MLNMLQFIFGLLTAFVAIYSLVSNNDVFLPLLNFLVGATLLIMAIAEIQEKRKVNATFLIFIFAFVIYVFLSY